MAIDASVYALQKPLPPPVNPMEVASHAMQLRNQQQAGQINAERLKQEQQQTAEGELKRRDDELQASAWQQAGGDPKKHVELFGRSGARPQAVQSLQKHYLDLEKGTAELDDKKLQTSKYHNDQFLGALQQAKALPDDQYAVAWPTIKSLAERAHPDIQLSDAPPPKDQLWQLELGLVAEKTLLEREDEKRKQAEAKRQATAAANADAAAQQKAAEEYRKTDAAQLAMIQEQQGPEALGMAIAQLPPERRRAFAQLRLNMKPDQIRRMAMDAGQVVTADQARANAERQAMPNTPTELAIWANDPKRTPEEKQQAVTALRELERHAQASRPINNNIIPGMGPIGAGGANQTTGEEFLKAIPPSIAAQVKAIAEGRAAIPSASSRSQAAVQIRDAVFRYDPTFSEQRAQVRRALTTGPEGKNIGALNTAIVHLGRLGDTAEALQNGSFTPGNELYNWARDKFGSEKVTNFGLLKDAVAGEMAAALKGSATDIEIEKMGKSIRASNSPAQMRGVIQEGMGILSDKATTYDERYHREMPDDTAWSPILPSAKAQLQRHGIKKTGGENPGTGAGGTVHFVDGGVSYDIPGDKAARFLATHPNAKRGN